MKILLTNDDGIRAEGIKILYRALQKYGEVYLIAPEKKQSGKSASISFRPLTLTHYENNVYSLGGTPADCVSFAVRCFPQNIDLVVSGCNDGLNIVYDTVYSGTIGAALEAHIQGIPSLAISTDDGAFQIVRDEIDAVLKFIFQNDLISASYVLSVNFPTKEHLKSKGYRLATLGKRVDDIGWQKIADDTYLPHREVNYDNVKKESEPSDNDLCREGYVVFTPLTSSLFAEKSYQTLKEKECFKQEK